MTCRRSNTSRQKSRARFQRLKEARKMKVRQLEGGYCTQEDLTKAKEEKEDLQEKFENLLKMGTHKNLETEFQNKIWAGEQRKLWEAQKLIIDQQRTIEGLEEGVCQLISHNIGLQSSRGHAEAAFEEAKQMLFEECNIILSNGSTSNPSYEEVD
ncbi:hypothetical protein GLOIN_2v1774434 [Rhizophagus irregularis DAOM 181602=DAOM 197198]|nr:hypothetical protein GLOIN_2v1774434 [Rhizophagus irregularis DAOM 181602=DAOM 197198]